MDVCTKATECANRLTALIRGHSREIESSMLPMFLDRHYAIQKINEALDIFLHQHTVIEVLKEDTPWERTNRFLSPHQASASKFCKVLCECAHSVPNAFLRQAIAVIGEFYGLTEADSFPECNKAFRELLAYLPGGSQFEIIHEDPMTYWEHNIARRSDIDYSFQYTSPAGAVYGRTRHSLARLRIATLNAFGFAYMGTGLSKTCTLYFHREEDEILARITYPNGFFPEFESL